MHSILAEGRPSLFDLTVVLVESVTYLPALL
ncbi:hypothetical protein CHELA40_50263 [Chelatococcus asaccharovorans]|nr:hypothetical protein CHELA40_50263 [Chelatococcus asaccharovorans]